MEFNNEISERQLLQSVIYMGDYYPESGAFDEMVTDLDSTDFSTPERITIFNKMKELRTTGNVDTGKIYSSLSDNVRVMQELKLMENIATTNDIGYLVRHVLRFSTIKKARRASLLFVEALSVNNDNETAFKAVVDTMANLSIASTGVKNDYNPDERLKMFLAELEERTKSDREIRGLKTGFPSFDKASGGLHGGDLVVVGALPGMGKTSWALSVAANVILNGGSPTIFSFEMNRYALDANLISLITMQHPNLSPVPKWVIENPKGHITSRQLNDIGIAVNILRESGAFIVDRSCPNRGMDFIRSACYKRKAEGKLDIVITDYIGLMIEDENKAREEISQMTKEQKRLGCDLDIPAILLSQLNVRDGTKVTRPNMGMLKGSGSIEANADIIVFPWRQYVIAKEGDPSDGTLFSGKERAFGGGDIPMRFDTNCVGFQEDVDCQQEEGRF